MGHNQEEPLLQTYWLPDNPKDESSAFAFAWLLFGAVTLAVIFLTATFS